MEDVVFWAFITAVCGLIPMVGTIIVSVPLGEVEAALRNMVVCRANERLHGTAGTASRNFTAVSNN